jgi:hypothetical protein
LVGRDGSVLLGVGKHRHDEDAPKHGQPGQVPAEVVAGGGEDGVGGVAVGALEVRNAPRTDPYVQHSRIRPPRVFDGELLICRG